jgi:phage-related protein
METPTGPRANRALVLLVLPFYLAWSAMRSLASALMVAADRAAELIAGALKAIGDLLRPVAARLKMLARAVGRIMARIGGALAQLARIVLRALDATVGRVLRVIFDGLGRLGVALAHAITLAMGWVWDPRSPIRIVLVAIASAARRLVNAVVRLARFVGPPLARAVAGVRRLLDGLARAAGTVVAAIRSIVGPVLARALAGARALLQGLARTLAHVAAPVMVAARRLAADLMRAVSPFRGAVASAVRDARRAVRHMLGLSEGQPPR